MNRVVSAAVMAGLALSGLSACKQQAKSVDIEAETAAIKAVEDEMREANKARDPERLAATYADDATLYAPGQRPHVGKAALLEAAKQDFADPDYNLAFTTAKAQVSASGDMGYTQGSFNIRYTDPATKNAVSMSGYYLTVFKKQADGSWKALEDMATPAS